MFVYLVVGHHRVPALAAQTPDWAARSHAAEPVRRLKLWNFDNIRVALLSLSSLRYEPIGAANQRGE